ncbi:hypothetical protein Y032_0366g20 [Ancylostoma ceylanicum]|uniref:Uncharacterized protein n=1 Tax=Ancylostoma ceylanicum TaxID=53326 RepID=A0A016RUY2_9BILA|nr:hypothetical protein Y032_0366g20 [Ancylostoma ceylanicum]
MVIFTERISFFLQFYAYISVAIMNEKNTRKFLKLYRLLEECRSSHQMTASLVGKIAIHRFQPYDDA